MPSVRAAPSFPPRENWLEFTEDLMAPFVDHPEIDPALFAAVTTVKAVRHKRGTRPFVAVATSREGYRRPLMTSELVSNQ